jgi:hypothetical protein
MNAEKIIAWVGSGGVSAQGKQYPTREGGCSDAFPSA